MSPSESLPLTPPGPKKTGTLPLEEVRREIEALRHGTRRTRGLCALQARYTQSISRRAVADMVAEVRRRKVRERRHVSKRVTWKEPNLALSVPAPFTTWRLVHPLPTPCHLQIGPFHRRSTIPLDVDDRIVVLAAPFYQATGLKVADHCHGFRIGQATDNAVGDGQPRDRPFAHGIVFKISRHDDCRAAFAPVKAPAVDLSEDSFTRSHAERFKLIGSHRGGHGDFALPRHHHWIARNKSLLDYSSARAERKTAVHYSVGGTLLFHFIQGTKED